MSSGKLSVSLLKSCNVECMNYEQVSEQCDCSTKLFLDVVHMRTRLTLDAFEKICFCYGFHRTQESLSEIDPSRWKDEVCFRIPMPVKEICVFPRSSCIDIDADTMDAFPVCPRCGFTLEREYQAYCDRCGQCLSWNDFQNATVITRP